jgi:hypothetical protein
MDSVVSAHLVLIAGISPPVPNFTEFA